MSYNGKASEAEASAPGVQQLQINSLTDLWSKLSQWQCGSQVIRFWPLKSALPRSTESWKKLDVARFLYLASYVAARFSIFYLAATGLARPASGSKYQKRVIFKADFDSLRGSFPVRLLTKLRKCRDLRGSAASLTLFVMRVYKSIKIKSLREEFW